MAKLVRCPECQAVGRSVTIYQGPFRFGAVDCPACDSVSYLPSRWAWIGEWLCRIGIIGSVHLEAKHECNL